MEATRILREEHELILRGLRVLSVLADRSTGGTPPAPEDVATLVELFRELADALHHHKEEGLLFPAMERAGVPAAGGPIAVMLAEHEEGRRLVQRIADAGPGDLGPPARQLVELLSHHIEKENRVLFEIAEARIDPAAARALDAEFEKAVAAQSDRQRAQLANLEALEAKYPSSPATSSVHASK